jgi:hypothetical protein
MPTHYKQISVESIRRVLAGAGTRKVIQMPAPVSGIAGSSASGEGQPQRILPTLVAKCRPARPAETPARPTSGGERWRQIAEAASREQDTCTLLKLVEDLVRELPDAAPVQRKNANVRTE